MRFSRLYLRLSLALLFLPALALAQDAPAPAPSVWQVIGSALLSAVTSPAGISIISTAILALVGALGLKANRKRQIALAAYHAFHIVNDIDAELGPDNTTLDKPREGLRAVDEWMKANGWRELKPGEQPLVQLQFKSLHGQEKQAVKVQADAQVLAAAATSSPAPAAAKPSP